MPKLKVKIESDATQTFAPIYLLTDDGSRDVLVADLHVGTEELSFDSGSRCVAALSIWGKAEATAKISVTCDGEDLLFPSSPQKIVADEEGVTAGRLIRFDVP